MTSTVVILLFLQSCGASEGVAAEDHVDLVTFGGESGSTFDWSAADGGGSKGTFAVNGEYDFALFNGTAAAGADSFCSAMTKLGLLHKPKFRAASGYTHLMVYYRSTAAYGGFQLSLAAKDGAVSTKHPYKASFNATADGVWRVAAVPFAAFSGAGGAIVCSAAAPQACLSEAALRAITQVGLWAEGTAGAFSLQVKWIRAGFGDTCSSSEYCCPSAMKCLTPSNTPCKGNPDACTGGSICCPLTQLCVHAGSACTSACQAPWAEKALYCCPDAKACLAPTDPGVLCANDSDCEQGHSTPVVCCPLTKLCVTAADACMPGDSPAPSWWPAKGVAN